MRPKRRLTQANSTLLFHLRYLFVSIGFITALFLFHERAVADQSIPVQMPSNQGDSAAELKADLVRIDQKAAEGLYTESSVLVGKNIKARDIYRNYLERADNISKGLLSVGPRLDQNISLQQLGALTQNLSLENERFKGSFTHGEDQFQTYKLIQTAVHNLEDASSYWRIANRYRALYRGTVREHMADDQILKLKIQTALNAIDELKVIVQTREALTKDLLEDER